jgi:hypothetical protein
VDAQVKIAVALLLATVPWSASAETDQNEKRDEVIAKLRACVRMYAPAAQVARTQNNRDPVEFLIETCSPPLRVTDLAHPKAASGSQPGAILPSDLAGVGAIPPGLFRHIVGEEWTIFRDQKSPR